MWDVIARWAVRLAPYVEGVNAWYTGDQIDGKDAAELGELFAALREAGRLVPAGGEHWGLLVSALRDAETMAENDENEARAEAIRALRLELTP
jgi:hypothetical protein